VPVCQAPAPRFREPARALHEVQVGGRGAREDPLQLFRREAPERCEQSAEHGAILIQDRIVTVLKEALTVDRNLLPGDASAVDAAAQDPVDRAVTVIGTLVAILTESATELGNDGNDR
jgi:hypothetical protein